MPDARDGSAAIDAYVSDFPPDVAELLTTLRAAIRETLPDAEEAISYGIPTYRVDGRAALHFAGWARHLSVYPIPDDPALAEQLAPYRRGKGTLQFRYDRPLPIELISTVARRLGDDARRT